MLTSIEKALKLSEIREQLNDLNAVTDPTEAQQTEERDLIASHRKRARANTAKPLTAEADEHATVEVDAEERARLQLVGRCNVGRIVAAFAEHRSCDGAEAEIQQHHGLAVESGPARSFAPAGRASRRHDRTHERRHDRATGHHADLRGGRRGVLSGQIARSLTAGTVAYPVLDQRPDRGLGRTTTIPRRVDETDRHRFQSLATDTPAAVSSDRTSTSRVDAARFSVAGHGAAASAERRA